MEVVSDEEAFLFGMELAGASAVSMVLKSALELGILETIAKAGPGAYLSPSHIATTYLHTPSINCLMVRLKGTMVFTQKPNTLSTMKMVSLWLLTFSWNMTKSLKTCGIVFHYSSTLF